MAYQLRGPLAFQTVKDGKPVFTHGGLPAPAQQLVTSTAPTGHITVDQPPAAPAPAPASAPAPKPEKRRDANTFGGKCSRCNVWVEPEKGRRAKEDGKWKVFHLDGACTPTPAPGEPAKPTYQNQVLIPIPDGAELRPARFTIDDAPDHVSLRILRQAPDATFKPGVDMIGVLTSGNRYETFAHIDPDKQVIEVWRRFRNHHQLIAALQAVVDNPEAHRTDRLCIRCGLVLTHPDSIWYGPECRKKV